MKRYLSILLIAFTTVVGLHAQVYPVRTITTVSPPYPTSLEQYANVEDGHISVTLIPNDAALQNYPVKLRLVINGGYYKIYTNPSFVHKSIVLNNGESLSLTGPELAEWFNPDNLIFEGYTKNQYLKTGRLPEGMYQIWFEVYDFYRDINISGSIKELKATIWTFENDPPILNFPANEKEVPATDPQNIILNWTQRQAPFSSAGALNQFKLEVWEVVPDDMNVEEAVRTTRPIYSGEVQSTTFNYSADQPILFPGKKYAWRVQVYDPSGKNRYKNDGYSEVRWFRFGKDCTAPIPGLDKIYFTAASLKWMNDIRFDKYELRWKNKDIANSNWYTKDATGQGLTIDKLEQNTSYYVQMRGFCGAQEGEFSQSLTIHTKQDASFACGGAPGAPDSTDNVPLAALKEGEVFKAYDFDIQTYKVSGGNGSFTGKGFALVPLLKSIKFEVEFSGITINSKRRMTNGEVKFIYNEKNGLVVNVGQLITAITGSDKKESNPYDDAADKKISISSPVASINVSATGDVTVVTEDGHKQTVRASSENADLVYVGDGGDDSQQSVVDTKSKTVYTGTPEKSSSGSSISQPTSKNEPVKYAVTFLPHTLTTLGGMDYPTSTAPTGNYNLATIGGNQLMVPWKSVESNKIDRLVAAIDGPADSIHFITKNLNMVMSAPGDKSTIAPNVPDYKGSAFKQLLVTGVDDEDEIKAWYPEYEKVNDTTTRQNRILAGQVNIAAYDKINLDVCLVEVNGATVPNTLPIEQELNKIYASSLVQWKVTQLNNINIPLTTLKNGKFDSDHPGSMKYNDCENEIIDAFKSRKDYNRNTLYLFFIGGEKYPTTNTGTKGYMQFNRNFGFIFRDNQNLNELIRTMAHELGHGAFRLRHVFSPDCPYPQTQGQTQNLMDYVSQDKAATALLLHKYQWKEVHDWDLGVNWFEGGDEGEILKLKFRTLIELGISEQGDINFVRPDGKIITFDVQKLQNVDFSQEYVYVGTNQLGHNASRNSSGVLSCFTYEGITYFTNVKGVQFEGYYPNNSRDIDRNLILSKRFDKDNSDFLRNSSQKTVKVYIGSEKETCTLEIKSGLYNSSHIINSNLCKNVTIQNETLLKTFSDTTGCLEWFNESTLSPLAKVWWKEAQKNKKFNEHENICRRITRLLNDLEKDCKSEDKEHLSNLFDIVVVNKILKDYTSYKPRIVDPSIEFKTTDLEIYENSIRVYSKALKDVNSTLENITDNSILYDLLTTLPLSHYNQISYSQRLKCIQALCKGNLTSYTVFGNKTELAVINLLLTIPKTEQKRLLDDLIDSQYAIKNDDGENKYPHLLAKLYNGIDGDNFVKFTTELLHWIIENYKKDPNYTLSNAVNDNRFITFNPGTWMGHALDESFTDDGQVNLFLRKQFTLNIQDVTTKPYNYVYVKFKDEFKYSERLTFKKGEVLALPACYIYSLFNQANNEKLTAGLKLAIDVGLCFIGIGEFNAAFEALSTARKVYLVTKASIDLAVNVSDIVINDLMVNELESSEAGKKFLNSWNTFQLYYGIGSIATTGVETLVKKLYGDANELRQLENLSEEVREKLDDITDKVYDETKVAKEATATEAKLEEVIDNLGDIDKKYADEILSTVEEGCDAKCAVGSYGCFVGSTPITTKTGFKSIMSVKEGNEVLSYNSKTFQKEFKIVSAVRNYITRIVIILALNSGEQVLATPNHPFYKNGNYVEASTLQVGDTLYTANEQIITVKSICTKDTTAEVYNLTVVDNNNYFVGNNKILVHNTCLAKSLNKFDKLSEELDKLAPTNKKRFMKFFQKADEEVLDVMNSMDNSSLNKFLLHITSSNDEGLKGLCEIMKTSKKDAELVVDSWKKAEKSGCKLKKKGFPTPDPEEGSESFVLTNAKQYQSEASGNALFSFEKNGVSFDNIDGAGVLIDRKYGHGGVIFKKVGGEVIAHNEKRVNSILEQAERQVMAAKGAPVRWEISTELGAEGILKLFKSSNNPAIRKIDVKFVGQIEIIKVK